MEKKGSRPAIAWCVFLYFVILFAERAQSLVRLSLDGYFLASGFDIYVNFLTAISLAVTLVLLILFRKEILRPLFDSAAELDYGKLSLTVGVLLLSGMVHTEYTVAPVQFAAYGALIIAMILRTIEASKEEMHKVKLWYSLVYLIAFSMAIPVMYRSAIERAVLFHVLEGVTAALLVLLFSLMMYRVFIKDARDLLSPIPVSIAAVLDAVILWMKWEEEVNTFVLIFLSLTVALFVVGKIGFLLSDRKSK